MATSGVGSTPARASIDQISGTEAQTNPGKRHVVRAWSVADGTVWFTAVPHALPVYVAEGASPLPAQRRYFRALQHYSYVLTMMVAQVTGYRPGEFVHTFGDAHLYCNHLEQARTQLAREPLPLPEMRINPAVTDLFGFRYEDFELVNYQYHPAIKAPIAV